MSRLPDWEARLGAYVETVLDRPYAWGQHDCGLFAAGAVQATTGNDIAADYRGQYSDREGAAELLKTRGKGTLVRTLNSLFERRKPGKARRGDLVWFKGSVGVCMGAFGLFVGEIDGNPGLIKVVRGLWQKAWTVE